MSTVSKPRRKFFDRCAVSMLRSQAAQERKVCLVSVAIRDLSQIPAFDLSYLAQIDRQDLASKAAMAAKLLDDVREDLKRMEKGR